MLSYQDPSRNVIDYIKTWVYDSDMIYLVVVWKKVAVSEGLVLYSGWWGNSKFHNGFSVHFFHGALIYNLSEQKDLFCTSS